MSGPSFTPALTEIMLDSLVEDLRSGKTPPKIGIVSFQRLMRQYQHSTLVSLTDGSCSGLMGEVDLNDGSRIQKLQGLDQAIDITRDTTMPNESRDKFSKKIDLWLGETINGKISDDDKESLLAVLSHLSENIKIAI